MVDRGEVGRDELVGDFGRRVDDFFGERSVWTWVSSARDKWGKGIEEGTADGMYGMGCIESITQRTNYPASDNTSPC